LIKILKKEHGYEQQIASWQNTFEKKYLSEISTER